MAGSPVSYTDVVLRADQGVDYEIILRQPGSPLTIVALQAGALEPGLAELATAVAEGDGPEGEGHNLYIFSARQDRPALRISPLRAREARLDRLVESSMAVVSITCCQAAQQAIFLGGANTGLCTALRDALAAAGWQALPSQAPGADLSRAYFYNRAAEGGAELALSAALRDSLCSAGGEAQRRVLLEAVRQGLRQYLAAARSDLGRTLQRFERDTARIPPEIRQGPGRRERNSTTG